MTAAWRKIENGGEYAALKSDFVRAYSAVCVIELYVGIPWQAVGYPGHGEGWRCPFGKTVDSVRPLVGTATLTTRIPAIPSFYTD